MLKVVSVHILVLVTALVAVPFAYAGEPAQPGVQRQDLSRFVQPKDAPPMPRKHTLPRPTQLDTPPELAVRYS